ncbi:MULTISPECIES: hypothetical protein [Rhodococcus]|uniref:Uncharacterized protein n=1 Tax=Rhodococcus qingshengii JCM 15477 TaxID=1303681 RepID=A0AB38R5Q2_RHOSG|nr:MULTISPECIES: hypothetical protein [Rhodococcus]MCD2131377.1 hypothetical protein [Rhodococcus qingshengii]UPU40796.1 hypothetical protein M0639_17110 [Rhodococcus qingshengii JCM 15477]
MSSRRRSAHPAVPAENREAIALNSADSTLSLTDDPNARTVQVSARVTKARRAAFKAKLAQLGTTMDAEFNKCIDEVLAR